MNTHVAIHPPRLMRPVAISIVIALILAYVWLFLELYPLAKSGIAPLGVVPVVVAGWQLGRYGGLITGILVNIITVALFRVVGAELNLFVLSLQALPANILVSAAGYMVGRQRELLVQTQAQAQALAQKHALLNAAIEAHQQTEQELIHAKENADAASRAKSAFLANMSHELRTPLTAIMGYSELLRLEADIGGNAECVNDIDRILGASQHLLNLINSVLDLSKIEAGRMPLHMMSFSVPDLINDIVNAIQPTIAQRHNVLTVQLDPLVPTMYADPTKVRQSLFNLLGNAAKFTHNGHIRLQVGLNECGGKSWVTLAVHDTGIGIAPDQLSHLFKEFTQANNVTEQHGGTGLGLVISQRLCALMGGDIAVQSEVGRGSTFTIRLPARPEPTESQ